MQKQEWYIGIDFGTSNTYIVGYEKVSKKFYYSSFMPNELTMGDKGIPTVITVDGIMNEDLTDYVKTFYIGKEALQHPFLHIERNLKNYARAYDPDLSGDSAPCDCTRPIEFGRPEDPLLKKTVHELIGTFFKEIFDRINSATNDISITKDTIKSIVIGCPSMNGSIIDSRSIYYDEVLIQAIAQSFNADEDFYPIRDSKGKIKRDKNGNIQKWGKVKVIPEPELAGLTYLCSGNMEDDVVLVVDSGGGTTDFSLLYWEDGQIISKCIGEQCDVAGNEIDNTIKKIIRDERITKEQCRRGKEDLFLDKFSRRPRTILELHKADCMTEVMGHLIHYSNGDICLSPSDKTEVYDKIVSKLCEAMTRLKLENRCINKILFVGGTSFVSPLRDAIIAFSKNEAVSHIFDEVVEAVTPFDNEIRVKFENDSDPVSINCFNAVAIGACISAIDIKPTVFPTIEFSWDADSGQWKEMFSPKKNGVIAGILQDTMHFYCNYMEKDNVCLYQGVNEPVKFYIRINGKRLFSIEVTTEQIQAIQNDLILLFSLNKNNELIYSIYDGKYVEKSIWSHFKTQYKLIQDETKVIY